MIYNELDFSVCLHIKNLNPFFNRQKECPNAGGCAPLYYIGKFVQKRSPFKTKKPLTAINCLQKPGKRQRVFLSKHCGLAVIHTTPKRPTVNR